MFWVLLWDSWRPSAVLTLSGGVFCKGEPGVIGVLWWSLQQPDRRITTVRELLRGAIRLHVLHHAAIEEVNGAWMAEELARHGYRISPGTLYPTLHRMEEEGLLRSRKELRDGRVVRLYVATKLGRASLAEERKVLARLAEEVLGTAPT